MQALHRAISNAAIYQSAPDAGAQRVIKKHTNGLTAPDFGFFSR